MDDGVLMMMMIGKGGKNRRRGKSGESTKRELVFKEFGQEYGQITKMLGHGHLEVQCFDGVKRIGHIRGKMRKRVWMNVGDIILISAREFQDDRGDILMKYTSDEARSLKALGELPEAAVINETDATEENADIQFEMDDEAIDEI